MRTSSLVWSSWVSFYKKAFCRLIKNIYKNRGKNIAILHSHTWITTRNNFGISEIPLKKKWMEFYHDNTLVWTQETFPCEALWWPSVSLGTEEQHGFLWTLKPPRIMSQAFRQSVGESWAVASLPLISCRGRNSAQSGARCPGLVLRGSAATPPPMSRLTRPRGKKENPSSVRIQSYFLLFHLSLFPQRQARTEKMSRSQLCYSQRSSHGCHVGGAGWRTWPGGGPHTELGWSWDSHSWSGWCRNVLARAPCFWKDRDCVGIRNWLLPSESPHCVENRFLQWFKLRSIKAQTAHRRQVHFSLVLNPRHHQLIEHSSIFWPR